MVNQTPEELNEIAKTKIINRPSTSIFFFCNKVMEADYFTYQYKKDDENNDPVIERVRKVSREEKLYNKPAHIMSQRERNRWYSRFRRR
jgi:hypothetical protein